MTNPLSSGCDPQSHIAVIGMACRFPGAPDVESFWENLSAGRESISFFSDDELLAAGVDPALLENPDYVKAGAVLADIEAFDASFFGFTPREAEILDVQQRLFLECAWEALENGSVNPDASELVCGVFAGAGLNTYLLRNLYSNRDLIASLGSYQLMLANDKDYLASRVSYKFNLRGPAVTVQTACSTSLAAVHLACQSLLTGECDVALAGGVAVRVPHQEGYLHQEGMILSPDGHCRAFDAKAQGTVGGNGVGVVVLKPLEAAVRDGDNIRAIIRGSAINNDGALKAGYTAPSVEGQSAAISEAMAVAGVDGSEISYIETHGTATPIGDPIELAALKKAFGAGHSSRPWCALGSVKTNIGHLDVAAGVAGLIKAVLALERKQIPASLHFEQVNPQLQLDESPFYVSTRLTAWPSNGIPRRAGVSSFGIGGTNVHMILEEAPEPQPGSGSSTAQLLLLSARTESALRRTAINLSAHLKRHPELDLANVGYTLACGRRTFPHRRALVCRSKDDAIAALVGGAVDTNADRVEETTDKPLGFTFCGQGLQYAGMTAGLYAAEPVFREQMDECSQILADDLHLDIRRILYSRDAKDDGEDELSQTSLSQPILFAVQYALARMWMKWGIQPHCMIGHSIGEYVAACISGVFSLSDALALVAERGRLMQRLPAGGMLSVPLPEPDTRRVLDGALSLATVNAEGLSVVSGPLEAIAEFQSKLRADGIECLRLKTSHAFHSAMMDPVLRPFADRVRAVRRNSPRIPFTSNVTGTWIGADQALDPDYWARHLRETVQFLDGIRCALSKVHILLECGPSQGLARWIGQVKRGAVAIPSLRHPRDIGGDQEFLLQAAGRLWLAGAGLDWKRFFGGQKRRRIPLPSYPFERVRCWIEPPIVQEADPICVETERGKAAVRNPQMAEWFHAPSWKRSVRLPIPDSGTEPATWLIFIDNCGVGACLADRLTQDGQHVITVNAGLHFRRETEHNVVVDPRNRGDYDRLISTLAAGGQTPRNIVHLWSVDSAPSTDIATRLRGAQDHGFFSLLFLAQSLTVNSSGTAVRLFAVSNNMQQVCGEEYLCPEKATLIGPVSVIPRENPNISTRSIDVVLPHGPVSPDDVMDELLAELRCDTSDHLVAIRGGQRWVPAFEQVRLNGERRSNHRAQFRDGGAYLIVGGTGGIGLTLAAHLAERFSARLVLTGRTAFPDRESWDEWLLKYGENDRVSSTIRKVQQLERLGSAVFIACADVTSVDAMRDVCRKAQVKFGRIDGVIHAAGVPGGGVIELKTPDQVQHVLAPKVDGTLVLGELAREFSFEFLILCSSLTAILPEFGQVDYTAANAFQDAYVPYLRQQGIVTVGINWDTWHTVGMAVNAAVIASARKFELQQGIGPDEGVEALGRVLASGLARLVVSTRDIDVRLQKARAPVVSSASTDMERAKGSLHPRPPLITPYAAPTNPIEEGIANDWQDLLGISPVGISDNFFEMGGHSLLAIQIISRVWERFHVRMSLTAFFESPNIAGIAAFIASSRSADPTPSRPSRRHAATDGTHVPLSSSQQQLWVTDQIEQGSARYNEFGIHEITGRLDISILERSLTEIVRRHEVLRTTFMSRDGCAFQSIGPVETVTLPVIDLSTFSSSAKLEEAFAIAEREARSPFDLSSGPLFRFLLVRLDTDVHWLYLSVHHIVFDGWSGGIFVRELVESYKAIAAGRLSALQELPIQYADYAVWQRTWLNEERRANHLAYWRGTLAGATSALPLRFDRSAPSSRTFDGRRVSFHCDNDAAQRLRAHGHRNGATMFTTVLAAYAVLLQRYTGHEDIVIGAPFANRKWKEVEPMIGYFVNTLPLRVDLHGNPSFNEVLHRLQSAVLNAQEHSDLPLDELIAALQHERDSSGNALFRVLFVFRNMSAAVAPPKGLSFRQIDYESVPARSDLDFYVSETQEGLTGYFVYPIELFEHSSIERMSRRLEVLMTDLLNAPDLPIGDLPQARLEPLPALPAVSARRGRTGIAAPTTFARAGAGGRQHASTEDGIG